MFIDGSGIADDEEQNKTAQTEKELLTQAHNLYISAADGKKENVEMAEIVVSKILKENPVQFEAHAILGGIYTLKARDTFWVNKKIGYAKQGIKMMDEAVAGDPSNLQIRWVRGSNNIHMPKFLKRFNIAKNDLEMIWKEIQENKDGFSIEQRQKTGHLLGMAQFKSGKKENAEKTWKSAIEMAPESSISKKILETSRKLKSSKKNAGSKLGPGRFRR